MTDENIETNEDAVEIEKKATYLEVDELDELDEQIIDSDADDDEGPICATINVRRRRKFNRLDKYLQPKITRFSRTGIQKLIKEGAITVNGKKVKPSYDINPGDKIDLILPPPPVRELIAEDIPLDILYEDEYLVAVNKASNLVVHPARGNKTGTLVNAMLFHCQKQLSKSDDPIRPGVVHRLDKDTTGAIVMAKDDEAHWRLSLQFERRTIHKEYIAIVEGEFELDSDRIDAPIGPHPVIKNRHAVRPGIGRHASTVYHVMERLNGFTLVRLILETGRTHQLRVHLSHMKHPIVGDTLYGARRITVGQLLGNDDESPIIDRFALHAYKIEFRHPITGEEIKVQAPPPDDFCNLLELLRKR